MRTSFTARHYKAPEKLKQFAEKEVQRLTKYHENIVECEIVLDYIKQTQVAEIKIGLNGQRLAAKEQSDDVYKSITVATDKMERQLRKIKSKLTNKKGVEKAVDISFTE